MLKLVTKFPKVSKLPEKHCRKCIKQTRKHAGRSCKHAGWWNKIPLY